MEDKTSPLKKYSGKPYPPLEKVVPKPELAETERESYLAVIEQKRGTGSPRFKIVDEKGISFGCSYVHLLDWVFVPPDLLTLTTSTRIFIIEGKNLEGIERLLLEERVKELRAFNPMLHSIPDKAEPLPIIERLEIREQ